VKERRIRWTHWTTLTFFFPCGDESHIDTLVEGKKLWMAVQQRIWEGKTFRDEGNGWGGLLMYWECNGFDHLLNLEVYYQCSQLNRIHLHTIIRYCIISSKKNVSTSLWIIRNANRDSSKSDTTPRFFRISNKLKDQYTFII